MMLSHHGALDKLKLFHLEDGGFHHQRDYKRIRHKFKSKASAEGKQMREILVKLIEDYLND